MIRLVGLSISGMPNFAEVGHSTEIACMYGGEVRNVCRSSQSGPPCEEKNEAGRERVSVRSVSRSTIKFDTPDSKSRMEKERDNG